LHSPHEMINFHSGEPKERGRAINKTRILFLCTRNSCRSQMAEGWARRLHADTVEPYSAGIDPGELDPYAVRVMAEAGVDISRHRSKHLNELKDMVFDCVVTVCGAGGPLFPGKTVRIHRSFDDPPRLMKSLDTEGEILAVYRRVRDEIRAFVEAMPIAVNLKTGVAEGTPA
jgi:arsenate reductase